ncbi:hypothetical protein Lfu02_43010 [Longispora fulva]|uniref:Uncharacterized protein n=1 Tax=Longispora fulva TaxID=619741 RepID=A0A8J7GAF0_9ACTN|nr:hypothetical protein [Longispora fulva]MBG6136758.1 hypothetical protein [Longispora fulva]GIG59929.1 hypothetical protein Lfu02_43010 [Longispora fulva]
MTKFRVTVCLPPTAPADVAAALAAAMAPFDMNLDVPGWNERGQWDWWTVSAGSDRLLVKTGHVGDARLVYAGIEPGTTPSPPPSDCDGGPRGLLDLDGTRDRAVSGARAEWEAECEDWRRAVADHPPARPWAWFEERHRADPVRYPLERARIDHQDQPLNQSLAHFSVTGRYPHLGIWALGSDPVAHFSRGGQHFLDAVAASAIATWAVLTVDGTWIDGDQSGPLDDIAVVPEAGNAHLRRVAAYIEALDDDVLVIQLLCHC